MELFVISLTLLILAVIFFISYPIFKKKFLLKNHSKICERKVTRIAKKNSYYFINNLKIRNLNLEDFKIDHIIFGKKYIYLVSDYLLLGEIKGLASDNSWFYYNSVDKKTHYISNLIDIGNKNIKDFAGILRVNSDIIRHISLIPTECQIDVKKPKNSSSRLVNMSKLDTLIYGFEEENIPDLNKKTIKQNYEILISKYEHKN